MWSWRVTAPGKALGASVFVAANKVSRCGLTSSTSILIATNAMPGTITLLLLGMRLPGMRRLLLRSLALGMILPCQVIELPVVHLNMRSRRSMQRVACALALGGAGCLQEPVVHQSHRHNQGLVLKNGGIVLKNVHQSQPPNAKRADQRLHLQKVLQG